MREILMGEPQNPSLFAEKISQRNLPIEPQDALEFAQFMIESGAPTGFLDRLLASMQYKPEVDFWNDFDKYAARVVEQMRDEKYSVMFYKRLGSGRWIHELLMNAGLHEAEEKFTATRYHFPDETNGIHSYNEIEIFHREGTSILIPEDFSLTGAQVGELVSISRPHTQDIRVALMYATDLAKKVALRGSQHTMLVEPEGVHSIRESIKPKDLKFMQKVNDQYGWELDNWLHDGNPFFWIWYKVPDNVFDIFTDEAPHPLIRRDRFKPPYPREL